VLKQPEIPLHTNASENDIRCYVTRRKLGAVTRSGVGRDCRDTFLGLARTCDKPGIAVWHYLGSRLKVTGQHRSATRSLPQNAPQDCLTGSGDHAFTPVTLSPLDGDNFACNDDNENGSEICLGCGQPREVDDLI